MLNPFLINVFCFIIGMDATILFMVFWNLAKTTMRKQLTKEIADKFDQETQRTLFKNLIKQWKTEEEEKQS